MSTIIAGRFKSFGEARQAEALLIGSEFDADDICTFAVLPPGQHAAFPIGGDEYADAGARKSSSGAVKGAALGGAVGLGTGIAAAATIPEAAPTVSVAAAAVGAYTGSLIGALQGMGPSDSDKPAPSSVEPRKAGVLVAARTNDEASRETARNALKRAGAEDIEIASGTWSEGAWVDFDPTVPPVPAD